MTKDQRKNMTKMFELVFSYYDKISYGQLAYILKATAQNIQVVEKDFLKVMEEKKDSPMPSHRRTK